MLDDTLKQIREHLAATDKRDRERDKILADALKNIAKTIDEGFRVLHDILRDQHNDRARR